MIIANLATYPGRRHLLENVVSILSRQVDIINVVLNEYNEVPEEIKKYPNVFTYLLKEDLKDMGKFYPDTNKAKYILLVDDDIIYPHDYVSETVRVYESLNLAHVVGGYHGSIYIKPKLSFYIRKPWFIFGWKNRIPTFRKIYGFDQDLNVPVAINQVGTGTTILRGADMPPFEYMMGSQKFVDVRFARWCFERGIKIICLPRTAGWLGQCQVDETLAKTFTGKHFGHVIEEINTFAYKNGCSPDNR